MAEFSVPPAGETYDPIGYLNAFLYSLEDQLREALDAQPGDLSPWNFTSWRWTPSTRCRVNSP